jgi:hypothetical protein
VVSGQYGSYRRSVIHFLFLLEMDSTIYAPSNSTWALRVFGHLICSGGDERVKDQVK